MLHRTTGSIASCLGAIRAAAVGKVGRAALGARGLAIPARPTLMILRRGQDRIRQAMPGGRMGGPFAALLAIMLIAAIGFFGFTVRVNPEELGVVLRFGKFVHLLPPGLNFRWPYPIEVVELPKVTRVNRIELGMRGWRRIARRRLRSATFPKRA